MKKFILGLILLFFSSISYADFNYCKGLCYQNCKVKIFYDGLRNNLEKEINDFSNGKTVIDIRTKGSSTIIIIYK